MPFQPATGVLQVETFFAWQGQRMENVYHVGKADAWILSDVVSVAGAFTGWISDHWRNVAHLSASFVGIKCTDLTTETGVTYEPTLGEPVAGLNNGTAAPSGTTIAVSWKTAARGRSFRGRTFHVGVQQESYVDSRFLPTPLGALVTAYSALIDVVDATPGSLAVLSRKHDGALRDVAIYTPIISLAINSALDSQRRRLPERGL